MQTVTIHRRSRRTGSAFVYIIILMSAMMAFCSLAVDMARYEEAHVQLYNAAMAAARAGAQQIPNGTASAVSSAATAAATYNQVDGAAISSSSVTVDYLNWTSSSNYTVLTAANFSQANACRVTISYTVPLLFAKVVGLSSKVAVEHSTAMVQTQVDTPHVLATGDVWLSGEPTGTQGSQADPNYAGVNVNTDHRFPYDIAGPPGQYVNGKSSYTQGQPYSSPVQVAFTVTPGSTITITNSSGSVSYDYNTPVGIDATGNSGMSSNSDNAKASSTGSEHGISDVTMPLGAMTAVFLGSSVPDNIATPPPALNFGSQTERDYVGLQPKLQQAFYAGNGQTSGGVQQQIVVPPGATRLFLGIMDGWEWDNNHGAFDCTVTQTTIVSVE